MILLIVKTIVIYPVLLFCGRIVLEDLFRNWNHNKQLLLRVTIATIWVLSSCTLAILVPNIAIVINYLGSLANLFVFILPGLSLYLALFNSEQLHSIQCKFKILRKKSTILCISVFFIAYGSFITIISIDQSVKQTLSK